MRIGRTKENQFSIGTGAWPGPPLRPCRHTGPGNPAGMAVFGPLSTVRAQLAADARFQAAFDYVAEALQPGSAIRRRIENVAVGVTDRHDLAGGAFALEQTYLSKPRAEAFLESHRKYIDVQVVISGEEIQEVVDIAKMTVDVPYNPERDLIKYRDFKDTSLLSARDGLVCIYFPVDGHISRAIGAPVLVRKTVVKVPVG